MKSSIRLIVGILFLAAAGLAGLWPGAQAQTKSGRSAWPRAAKSTPTPTPTPAVTTTTLPMVTYDPSNGTASTGDVYRVKQAPMEMVPLQVKVPKPMFVGTPKDVSSPNLERGPQPYIYGGQPAAAPPEASSGVGALSRTRQNLYLSAPPAGAMAPRFQPPPAYNTESYGKIQENVFERPEQTPLSTFSVDVDSASYAIVRSMLNEGRLPPRDAVRIEELVNYFSYNYPAPRGGEPFAVSMELAQCPWAPTHKLARIGLKGREIDPKRRPASNLVFLIDVSGSMADPNKLPLVQRAMLMLLDKLDERDSVAIVVYASEAGMRLEPMRCDRAGKRAIREAVEGLSAGGSTQGSAGIQMAYDLAVRHYIKGGTNRVVLCTDGDFNVGVTSQDALVQMITKKAKSGVFLTLLGFGMGNLKDSTMEKLADKGNGNYGYIDSLGEARKVLGEGLSGTLVTIAKDVKIQVEFNPLRVGAYRLIGYEDRLLKKEDFNNDKKDAGEIGAGHTVTALYELVPPGEAPDGKGTVDPLKYQKTVKPSREAASGEVMTVKLRYKEPEGKTSKLMTVVLKNAETPFERASEDFRFAAAVASFGMILRGSPSRGETTLGNVIDAALDAKGRDENSARAEFVSLARLARQLKEDMKELRGR